MIAHTTSKHSILLQLNHPDELFELRNNQLFSEHRNDFTGIELALSDLRGHFHRKAIRLVIALPDIQLTHDLTPVFSLALRRHCEHRIAYNRNSQLATLRDGFSALWTGCTLAAIGLILSYKIAQHAAPTNGGAFVADHLGWMLAWVGLWHPLDTIFFSSRPYLRENRDLRRLCDAEIEVVSWSAISAQKDNNV